MPTRRLVLLALLLTAPRLALADYAPPPDRDQHEPFPRSREPDRGESPEPYPAEPSSTVRVYTGPALRLAEEAARVGLLVAADVGAGPAGLRASGTFVGTGADQGFALYAGELFIDFGKGNRLHPIVAAGAGLCRLEEEDGEGQRLVHSIGVGLLRGTLQYRFAVEGVDARAGLDVSAQVRAFGAAEGTPSAWLAAAATVGVGF